MMIWYFIVSSLKILPNDKETSNPDQPSKNILDDITIQLMESYFHVQDREVLLKYLKDTAFSARLH
jgi:hypothetical protein